MKSVDLALVFAAVGLLTGGARAADLMPGAAKPVPAELTQSAVSGTASIYGGYGSNTSTAFGSNYDDSYGVLGGDARLNFWVHPNMSLQLDAEGEVGTTMPNCCGDALSQAAAGAHWSYRDPSSFLIGVFGGIAELHEVADYGQDLQWLGGFEAQKYFASSTLYGQIGYTGILGPNLSSTVNDGQDMMFVRVVGRYFFTPNDKLQIEGAYATGKFSYDGDSSSTITWGASYEHKFANAFSGFLEYAGLLQSNPGDSYQQVNNEFLVGLRVHFGQKTLKDEDRNGATLDLPRGLIRSLAWSGWDY